MHLPVTLNRRPGLTIPVLRSLLVLLACLSTPLRCISASRTPNLERIFAQSRARTGKRPVIVIPGVLGTQPINSKTGEMIWLSAFRSTDQALISPITPDLAANRDDVVPGKIVETVKLARVLPEVVFYRDLLECLARIRRLPGSRVGHAW